MIRKSSKIETILAERREGFIQTMSLGFDAAVKKLSTHEHRKPKKTDMADPGADLEAIKRISRLDYLKKNGGPGGI